MEEYEPRQNEAAGDAEQADGGLPPEMLEQSEPDFVTETPRHGRNATMILATLLLIGAGAVWFMRMKAGPATAKAADPIEKKADETIKKFLSDGPNNINSMKTLLKDTEKVVQEFLAYPSKKQIALESLQTNPFRFSVEKQADPEAEKARVEKERLEKLAAEKAEIAKSVAKLQLQSILAGGRVPSCMISGRMHTEGEQVNGFVIEKITPTTVVVRSASQLAPDNVYRFQLTMKR